MPRKVKEWIGKTQDSRPPPKVRQRVYDRWKGKCHICKMEIKIGETWECDHKKALINDGANRESNLRPTHKICHALKTKSDVAEKSKVSRKRKKHLGIKADKPAIPARASRKKQDPDRNKRDPFPELPRRQIYG